MNEGTVFVELSPPALWPVAEKTLIGPRLPLGSGADWLRIFAIPDGRLKLEMAEMAKGTVILTSCPLTFQGEGYFRLGISWSAGGANARAFAAGVCIASNSDDTTPEKSAVIPLKTDIPPLPDEDLTEATIKFEPGNSGHSL